MNGFNNFIKNGLGDLQAYGSTNLTFDAYAPSATLYQTTTLQANDPLVHYMFADLFDSANNGNAQSTPVTSLISSPNPVLNERYQPWGRSVQMAAVLAPDISPFNLALKDPLIWSSDHWDFPTNKFPTVGWLGRVHRGTPWQTIYLKASNLLHEADPNSGLNIGTNAWLNWTGNGDLFDAANAEPAADRLLFDIFSTAPNDNATRGQLSVNVCADPNDPVAGLAAWSALFSGVMVLNNNTNGLYLSTYHTKHPVPTTQFPTIPSFTVFPIDPAGVNGASSPLWQIVTNINSVRTNFVNLDGAKNAFEHVGDVLSVPALTENSPFLNLSTLSQLTNGISDEMYEWLPQQAMSLLRASSAPRYVIYSYGQTLKPAPNGIVTSGSFFGMVANYQIAAEIATRAVVRVEGVTGADGTPLPPSQAHPHIVIESYNILPPD